MAFEGLLVLADDAWDGPKRARHKIPAALARLGHPTLWVESDVRRRLAGRPAPELRAVELGLFVAPVPVLRRSHYGRNPLRGWREVVGRSTTRFAVDRHLRRLQLQPDWVIAWQDPRWAFELEFHRRRGRVTAYFASDLYVDPSGRGRSQEGLHEICRAADLVFCTSAHIARTLQPHHDAVHVIPHGLDLEAWQAPTPNPPPALASIPRPRLLFAGVATVKFDMELWGELARARPDWQFVLVGAVDRAMEAEWGKLAALPNVHALGVQPAAALPAFLRHADVLAMPYRQDPVRTHSGLPNKFYEYLAAGRPILSTPFTDFEDDDPNLVVAPAPAWGRYLDALKGRPSRIPPLGAHDYTERAQRVAQLMSAAMSTPRAPFPPVV